MTANTKNITIVGAGIVGICCALQLQRDGYKVTLIDRDGPGEGTSSGNAGIFSCGSVHPEGMPGIWRKGLKMLTDPLGPATIRASYAPKIFPFLLRMLKESSPTRADEISQSIAALSQPALEHFKPLLADAQARELVKENGCLTLYESAEAFAAGRRDNAYRDRRNTPYETLGPDEIRQMAPVLGNRFAGAIYLPTAGHTVNPLKLSQSLFALFRANGGTFVRADVMDATIGNRGAESLRTADGMIEVSNLLIAAGAFSKKLTGKLANYVPLDTERGYHAVLPNANLDLKQCLLIPGRGIAVTQMDMGLRIAGTVEFAGLEAAPNYKRADVLVDHANSLFPDLNYKDAEKWMGYRPAIPDSLPVISKSPRHPNVFFAFGHGHLGLTQAAITGRLIADLVGDKTPTIDITPFRVDRF
jgi:D-amino-acid dehydrogenase